MSATTIGCWSNISSSFETGFRIEGNHNVLTSNLGAGQCAVLVTGHENLLINTQ